MNVNNHVHPSLNKLPHTMITISLASLSLSLSLSHTHTHTLTAVDVLVQVAAVLVKHSQRVRDSTVRSDGGRLPGDVNRTRDRLTGNGHRWSGLWT
jgi:hypothetical protein